MKDKILFIDRDGTIIEECPKTYQIDSIEKIIFMKKVIFFLSKIKKKLDYKFVLVSNQDGLGSSSFPKEKFWPIHNHIIKILKSEGIDFISTHIDKTFENEKKYTRKPKIGMLTDYLTENYDIEKSFVIGDRLTDVLLAYNLGCKSIWIKKNNDFYNLTREEKDYYITTKKEILNNTISLKTDKWKDIYKYLCYISYNSINKKKKRITLETNVKIYLSIYGTGKNNIKTGLGFFDHLLQQISIHGNIDLNINTKGDLHIDEHHTIEDTGITFGEIFNNLLGDRIGIERYGFYILPMDDCISTIAIDLGGRSNLVWETKFKRDKIGGVSTEMFYHFFKSFSEYAKCNIYVNSVGKNEHHKIESIFKCFARAVNMAVKRNSFNKIPSTKGVL
ncbi:bifunctional histidinol-phosphatase/imidazoleglycerol-phosphate dehydratase HisB [Blattabacterium cuenoti]|uniref:bifunctional histidinol-phosphatase/imidazoleglycerol-phosphate dehydratase HisB n=1 Tax=Blattabacterium cuenoti TaxID=1653831 RepID=UPI00163D2BCD|nr:bifunctional histidinol-phosphatase/imidazoleglycerol-phosphate dehydratase HisB [Blattabacterium cuenoti]